MGQGTESSETCADRPTEVSVIRFVSKNRIEEIAPKKEIFVCKHRGCGKTFTKLENFESHGHLRENLPYPVVKFRCHEPECNTEFPDPGEMWNHYRKLHSTDASFHTCPFTRCGSAFPKMAQLEQHIECCHRRMPTIPTEPEVICYEESNNVMEEDVTRLSEDNDSYSTIQSTGSEIIDHEVVRENSYSAVNGTVTLKKNEYVKEENVIISTNSQMSNDYPMESPKLRAALCQDSCIKNEKMDRFSSSTIPKNKDLLITKENFYIKYEVRSPVCSSDSVQIDSSQDSSNTIYISNDVSLTKAPTQDHKMELGNFAKAFKRGFERESVSIEDTDSKNDCSNDEEYTPKKQRMSRSKQEPYKCEVEGCGKTYKLISHYRHHQDSHKLLASSIITEGTKTAKVKPGKAYVSFYICKIPNCGVQLNNINAIQKHYNESHGISKPALLAKSTEVHRCKIAGCEMEFPTPFMLQKHFKEVHSKSSINNISPNIKTGNGSGLLVKQSTTFHDNTIQSTTRCVNFKTDFKAKHLLNTNEYVDSTDKNDDSSLVKEEPGD